MSSTLDPLKKDTWDFDRVHRKKQTIGVSKNQDSLQVVFGNQSLTVLVGSKRGPLLLWATGMFLSRSHGSK